MCIADEYRHCAEVNTMKGGCANIPHFCNTFPVSFQRFMRTICHRIPLSDPRPLVCLRLESGTNVHPNIHLSQLCPDLQLPGAPRWHRSSGVHIPSRAVLTPLTLMRAGRASALT